MLLPHFDGAQVLLKIWFLTHFVRVQFRWDAAGFFCPVGPQSISNFQLDMKPWVSCLFVFGFDVIFDKKSQKRALYVYKKNNNLIWHFYSENWRFKWVKEKWKVFQCPSSVLNAFSLLIGRLTHRCFTGGRVSGLIVQHIEL